MYETIKQYQLRVEQALDRYLPAENTHPVSLHRAMRYAVLTGGKRIRPILVYSVGSLVGIPYTLLDELACAVEVIHAYSLIHDDLPAMDNDDIRHGQLSCHKVFGEAIAILAGDALQALAFQLISQNNYIEPHIRIKMLNILSQAIGSRGLVGGQAIDLAATGHNLTLTELEDMHIKKTGALIRASVSLGALSQPEVEQSVINSLDYYAKCIGLAFQIRDDVLNVVGDSKSLGKSVGSDNDLNKLTYPKLLGIERACEHSILLYQDALTSLVPFGKDAEILRWLARYIIERTS